MSQPIISIIVPIYNSGLTIKRCIKSIQGQSLSNIEIILINDCSIDNSLLLCKKIAKTDQRIKIINNPKNLGVSTSRNKGIEIAIGKFIMFADSDDFVDKDWCKELYETQIKNPNALIVSNLYKDNTSHKETILKEDKEHKPISNYFHLYLTGLSGYPVNKIYNTYILKRYHIRFNPNCKIGEDVLFNIDYIKHCRSIIYINKPLYYYCINPKSTTQVYHEEWLSMHLTPFFARVSLIENKDWSTYCDAWFPFFISEFNNVFDKRCTKNFLQKMQYNHKIMQSKEFRFCVEHISGINENITFIRIIKTYNYYLFWIFQQIYKIKVRINNIYKL